MVFPNPPLLSVGRLWLALVLTTIPARMFPVSYDRRHIFWRSICLLCFNWSGFLFWISASELTVECLTTLMIDSCHIFVAGVVWTDNFDMSVSSLFFLFPREHLIYFYPFHLYFRSPSFIGGQYFWHFCSHFPLSLWWYFCGMSRCGLIILTCPSSLCSLHYPTGFYIYFKPFLILPFSFPIV